ncbi:uncharacterized protein LY89DRAFT_733873 [Mollisia scopiformis]|uniref:Uncharacterized protein n=1 Tax=Mollisia scopiformis TaxID=149040 RepID=A0A194X9R5_MOLSC|nr:uncharacterized protein LY89DRAFT_733873 [Mollisia scopiformis]KUJ16869.1 hypothetical protein LY89DRAFT_733873 [Mollisia scopiformis]
MSGSRKKPERYLNRQTSPSISSQDTSQNTDSQAAELSPSENKKGLSTYTHAVQSPSDPKTNNLILPIRPSELDTYSQQSLLRVNTSANERQEFPSNKDSHALKDTSQESPEIWSVSPLHYDENDEYGALLNTWIYETSHTKLGLPEILEKRKWEKCDSNS